MSFSHCVTFDAKNFVSISLSCICFLALSGALFLMHEDMKNEFDRRNKFNLGSETYLKKIIKNLSSETKEQYHFIVFRYNATLPCKRNRTDKTCHNHHIGKNTNENRSNKTITAALNGPNFCFKRPLYA